MGVQIPHSLHPEGPEENAVWSVAGTFGGGVPDAGETKGMPDRGRPFDAGPCAYDDIDTTQICSVSGDRVYQRQERDPHGRVYGERKRNFVGQHFWARGYIVSTVGRDEATIREYIRSQEKEDARLEQLNLWR